MKKRFIAVLLTFVMVLGLITVMGENVQTSAETLQDMENISENTDGNNDIKDKAGTALYGADTAKGVILVTGAHEGSRDDTENDGETVIKDADGNIISVTKKTTTVNKKGTTEKVTITKHADGSKSESSVKTTKSGKKVVTESLDTAPDGTTVKLKETVIIDEEGNTIISSKVVDKDAEGKTVQTVIYESLTYPEENGVVYTVSKMIIKNGKGKVKCTIERTENIVTNEDGSTIINDRTATIFKNGKTEVVLSVTETDPEGNMIYTASETIKESSNGKTKIRVDSNDNENDVYIVDLIVDSKGNVSITSVYSTEKEEDIPECVVLDDVDVEITALAKGAMKDNKILEKVEIYENIKTIGKQAFYGDENLKTIRITDSIKKIGKDAFKGIAEDAVFIIDAESDKDFDRVKNLIIKSGVSDTVTIERE